MQPPAEPDDLSPGLHAITDADPPARAATLAEQLDADLCATREEADALLAALEPHPPVDAAGLDELRAIAERLAAAARVGERTMDRAAEEVGERLAAAGAGVAVHPSTVRARAAAVLAARDVVDLAETRVRDGEAEAAAAEQADAETAARLSQPLPNRTAADLATEKPSAGRRRLFGRWGRRARARTYEEDTSESTSLLQQVAATTDEAFGARRAGTARQDQLVLLRAQRDRSIEELRVAERAWRDLAGEDAVEQVDDVVRRFDPQRQDALTVARETVGVRAVATLFEHHRTRWEEAWSAHGHAPPAFEPGWFARFQQRMTRPVVLVGDAVEQAESLALALPAAVVLAVERLASDQPVGDQPVGDQPVSDQPSVTS